MSLIKLPQPLHVFFSFFPLHTYPPVPLLSKSQLEGPTLWIKPPLDTPTTVTVPETSLLSADVECLKWQAYIALRGLSSIRVRWDVHPDGAIGERLPNLHVPLKEGDDGDGELLAPHLIPGWVDSKVGATEGDLEGYKDEAARDESRAWVALLEGNVHAALIMSQPPSSYLQSLFAPKANTMHPVQPLLTPPPAPLTGFGSLLPPSGIRISQSTIEAQYRDAIAAISERLGTDKWFLGSSEPTPLDALAFAYIHIILNAKDSIRVEVTRRVNLVAWEWRVRSLVRAAFIPARTKRTVA